MSALEKLSPEEQDEVRVQVRGLLGRTEAFAQMDRDKQRDFANKLVDVVAYLAKPSTDAPSATAQSAIDAEGLAEKKKEKDGVEKLQDRLAGKQQFAGKEFGDGAMKAGTQAFRDLVGAVNFPTFVSGLIEGVFTSIVNSSIRQMQAYEKLLEGVVKSVEQFASENVTSNQARDYLRNRFPDTFDLETSGGQPRLTTKDSAPDDAAALIKKELNFQGSLDLDEESEGVLLQRAKVEMARSKQQMLATMVLLGINRIVVTDGLINAKVVFDVKASDTATRQAKASMYDDKTTEHQFGDSGGWFSSDYDNTQETHKTVVSSAVDDTSESKAQLKANMTGEVRVNFKSETFPLDKMASSLQIESVNQRAAK
jgi:hypothetical protein